MRILHLSDIHVWSLAFNPLRLLGKRSVGMLELLTGRARRFRLERLESVMAYAAALDADHILITGDLTTTALPHEFDAAREALAPLLTVPERVTILPGNHDRYTRGAARAKAFEATFGSYAPQLDYPWGELERDFLYFLRDFLAGESGPAYGLEIAFLSPDDINMCFIILSLDQ